MMVKGQSTCMEQELAPPTLKQTLRLKQIKLVLCRSGTGTREVGLVRRG